MHTLNFIFVVSFWIHAALSVKLLAWGIFGNLDVVAARYPIVGQFFAYCLCATLASILGAIATGLLA